VSRFSQSRSGAPLLRYARLLAVLGDGRALGVPFYLHPRNPLPRWAGIYEGHSLLLEPRLGVRVEAATHAYA